MDVAISGAGGLIGSALSTSLRDDGHHVLRLTRGGGTTAPDAIVWDPSGGTIDGVGLEGIDAVVHLAGEPIGRPHWTAGHRERVLQSRVKGTDLLARTLAGLTRPPKVLISGSAIGYYGDRGDEILTEASPPGTGFLADTVQAWEAAAAPAVDAGIRMATIRSGIVIARKGGAFGPLMIPFRLGLGGKMGSGDQFWSCVALDDEIAAIRFLMERDGASGPFNIVMPEPARVRDMVRTMGQVLHRPTVLPAPGFALKAAVGPAMAEAMILASQRVLPERLQAAGFTFRFPTFEAAFEDIFGRG